MFTLENFAFFLYSVLIVTFDVKLAWYYKIPLKDSYVNEAFEFIKIYRKATKDKNTIESLNEIEHDLKEFRGKSKEKILNSLKWR